MPAAQCDTRIEIGSSNGVANNMSDARSLGGTDKVAMQHYLLGISGGHQIRFLDAHKAESKVSSLLRSATAISTPAAAMWAAFVRLRTSARTGIPLLTICCTTALPVLPVAPVTKIIFSRALPETFY